jgi:hypothetical protein
MNVERTAGLHIPIARDIAAGGRQFHNVAMARSCAPVWFQKPKSATQSRWTKGGNSHHSPMRASTITDIHRLTRHYTS